MDLWLLAETLMFMSLSMVLNRTVAPDFRHTRVELLSVGQALVRSLPDLLQAARFNGIGCPPPPLAIPSRIGPSRASSPPPGPWV